MAEESERIEFKQRLVYSFWRLLDSILAVIFVSDPSSGATNGQVQNSRYFRDGIQLIFFQGVSIRFRA